MSKGTVNKVILIGRLGKDPDMRYAPSGTAIANFSLATNHSSKDAEGNWTEQTEWHNVVVFGRQADDLGVASALKVEDAVRGPPMLVVADQAPGGIG